MIWLSVLVAGATLSKQNVVEVPFKIGETAIIVDATVNKRKLSLMFDTGFSGAVVVADSINLGKPTGHMTLRDFVGEMEAPTVKISSLLIGTKKIDVGDESAVQTPDDSYSLAYNTHCDGIMGFGVIAHDVTEINFEKNKFIFHPKSKDISQFKPDNKRTFLIKMLPTGHASVELRAISPSGGKMTLALDTGNSFYATTHREVLERTNIWPAGKQPKYMRQSGVASGAVDSWSARLKGMTIFGVPVAESVWDIIDLPSSSAEGDGTVGYQFLKHFNITIDVERRYVWLENFDGKTTDEEPGDMGFSIAWSASAKRAKVVHVTPDGPAEKAGIKAGDDCLSIDGIDLANFGYKRFRRLVEGPVGSSSKVYISRSGELIRHEIKRIPLVNSPD